MTNELRIAHCPSCGNVFQKNMRNLCLNCSTVEDNSIRKIERTLLHNRQLTNAELSVAADVSETRILSWIRTGKLKIYDFPKLADKCDSCGSPIRRGAICGACKIRIEEEIAHEFRQEKLLRERIRVNSYIARR